MEIWPYIGRRISAATDEVFLCQGGRRLGGGCINTTYLLEDGERRFILKTNRTSALSMFEAEADGLREIAAADVIRVPEPICSGLAEGVAFLVLEFIDFGSAAKGNAEALGRQLARLHRVTKARYGWHRDNCIGATPQSNTLSLSWPDFWREQRLGFQLELAGRNGYGGEIQRKGEMLLARLNGLLAGHNPAPSLLHGDLWSGNYAFSRTGEPVVFDPAVYYGDRETDLAMTELFGGFPAAFYGAYREAFPLDEGYEVRKKLYNLYHILNHLNLFGGAYLGQAEETIARLLKESA